MDLAIKTFDELTTSELFEILKARVAVFVVEQECAYQDIDDIDREAYHLCMREGEELKAYLRVFTRNEDCAQIGRVLTTQRRCGFGREILRAGIQLVQDKMQKREIYLEAQTYAMSLYEKEGFCAISEEFLEDGIPHVSMLLKL